MMFYRSWAEMETWHVNQSWESWCYLMYISGKLGVDLFA